MKICCPAKIILPLHFLTNVTRSCKVRSICTCRVQNFALHVMSGPTSRVTPLWATWKGQRTVVCFWSLCQQGSKDTTINSLLGSSATLFATTWHINNICRHSMLDPCNLGHSLPTLSCHNLKNILSETPEDKVTPSKASQHELLCMQYTKCLIARSQQKNEKLFCYKVLLKVQKSSWRAGWVRVGVSGLSSRWLPPSSSAWQLPVQLLSKTSPLWASSIQNYAISLAPRLWKSLCSSRAIWQPPTIYYRWLSMSCQIVKMKITKTLFFSEKSGFKD